MRRAYSVLEVRAIGDGDSRTLSGIATTPEMDRLGDVIEPRGVLFKNPLPLLWQHKHDSPVGHTRFEKPTDEGIEFEAELVSLEEPGPLKTLTDMAWQAIKSGLVRGVSIGFRPIESEPLRTGGVRFLKSEVLELSLVTIPANVDATILAVRAMDLGRPAGSPVMLLTLDHGPLARGAVRLIDRH